MDPRHCTMQQGLPFEEIKAIIFVFINAMIFAFITFVTNSPNGQKTLLKSKKHIFQISHLIFWKLQAAKYLIYDFTFTLSFFFI